MIFDRKEYINKLISREGDGMIKTITGIRRCGKTYLLFILYKQSLIDRGVPQDHIIELDFEQRKNKKWRDSDRLLEFIYSRIPESARQRWSLKGTDNIEEKYFVLLDEIQLVQEFEDVLNSFLNMSRVDVFVTGSNANRLSKDIITEFRGRSWNIRLHPLSFAEYSAGIEGSCSQILEDYCLYGGLPEVALQDTPQKKMACLIDIYHQVYLKGVLRHYHLRNEKGMTELVRCLASNVGLSMNVQRCLDVLKSSRNIEIGANTIHHYIEYLEESFIISHVTRYDVKRRRLIHTEKKYFFEDPGIRNAVLEFGQVDMLHNLENVMYNELSIKEYDVYSGLVETFGTNDMGKTSRLNLGIDLMAELFDKRLYVQLFNRYSDGDTRKLKMQAMKNVNDSFSKLFVESDYCISHYTEDGILIMGIYDFLRGNVL